MDILIQPIYDRLCPCFCSSEDKPAEAHVIDPDLLQGRDLLRVLQSRRRGDGEHLELSTFILRHDGEGRRNVEMDTSGYKFLHDLWSAPERNPVHGDAGKLLKLPR